MRLRDPRGVVGLSVGGWGRGEGQVNLMYINLPMSLMVYIALRLIILKRTNPLLNPLEGMGPRNGCPHQIISSCPMSVNNR